MLPVVLAGEDLYLLHYTADWAAGFTLRVGLQSLIERSQGGIEARTPTGDTLRASVEFELQLFEEELSTFRVALQRLGGKRVLCPVWPAAHRYLTGASVYLAPDGSAYLDENGNPYLSPGGVATPYLAAGVWLLFEEDWSAWAVLLGDEEPGFTPSSTAVRVPLLLGRFAERPRPRADTDRLGTCSIAFVEQSPAAYALAPMALAAPTGPTIGGIELSAFPLSPDWSTPPEAGEVFVEREEETTGHGREPTSIYHPQDPARLLSATYAPYEWPEIAKLLWFFLQRRGQAQPFWIPNPLTDCLLTAAAEPSDTVLHVSDAAALGDNLYIALDSAVFTEDPSAVTYAKILSVDTGANTVTLTAPIGAAFGVGHTVSTALLARFAAPELELRFATDQLAETRIEFIECPSEYYLPSGETLRETFAALPTLAYLYRFSRFYPGQTIVNRYTSHERDLLLDGETFLARGFEHDSIKDTIEPEDVSATIRGPAFPGNPLHLFSPHTLEVPLYCEIIECQVGPDGVVLNPVSLLLGKVGKPRPAGLLLSATVTSLLGEVTQEVPALTFQRECNVDLFSGPCGLLESAWTFTGTIDSIVGNVVTLSSLSKVAGGSLPTLDDHWFAAGRLWTGSGETYESRTIFDSAVGTGTVILTLSHPLTLTPGAPVYIAPGCGGSYSECVTKYSNRVNFRGFPWMPYVNPSILPIQEATQPTSKK